MLSGLDDSLNAHKLGQIHVRIFDAFPTADDGIGLLFPTALI